MDLPKKPDTYPDEEAAELLAESPLIVILGGKRSSGEDFYAYLRLTGLRLAQLSDDMARASALNLEQYGEVLYWNYGTTPPAEVKAYMAKHYGVDEHLEASFASGALFG